MVKGERRATVRLDQAETRLLYRFRLPLGWTTNLLVSTWRKYNQLRILLYMYSAAPYAAEEVDLSRRIDSSGASLTIDALDSHNSVAITGS